MSATATDPFTNNTTDDDQPAGQDPDNGKLFDVPRVKVLVDETDPTVIKLAFSGSIDLDRSIASDVEAYNALKSGQRTEITVEVHVAGAKKTHRRDSEGDVDAVVETKSLIVTSFEAT